MIVRKIEWPDTFKELNKIFYMNIGIVGVGLLGGSLAAILKQKYGSKVSIFAFSSHNTLAKAKETGFYSGYHTYDELSSKTSNLDFIFLCAPIKIIVSHIEILAQNPLFERKVVITDIGSTKKHIMDCAEKYFGKRTDVCYIGGHPMTGNEFSGIEAADPTLYENAIYVITPTDSTPNDLLNRYIDLVKDIGAIPMIMNADKHDKVVAGISHLPQMLATGLVDLISKEEHVGLSKTLSAGGFRDMTRIASSQYKMWADIISTNKQNIEFMIDSYISELKYIKQSLQDGEIEKIFENARATRADIPLSRKGLMISYFEITVRVLDEPGTLLKISTILADNGINIKDISVQKSRENAGGHFRLGFDTELSRTQAIELLQLKGYSASSAE